VITAGNPEDLGFAVRAWACDFGGSTLFLGLACGEELFFTLLFRLILSGELSFFLFAAASKLLLKMLLARLSLVEWNIAAQTPAKATHLAVEYVAVAFHEEGSYSLC
jgi:hypothetical protein